MTTLILGDCASAGTNILTGHITGQSLEVHYSLRYNQQYKNEVLLWYLNETHGTRTQVLDKQELYWTAYDYLAKRELEDSYPKYFDFAVHNVSKLGATAQGYYLRLQKYISKHGRPQQIIVTDFSSNHQPHRVNYNGEKYFLEATKQDKFEFNPRLKSPQEVQKIAFDRALYYFNKGIIEKRNTHAMKWFLRYLHRHEYNYELVRFNERTQFTDEKYIDCTHFRKQFHPVGMGELCDVKASLQKEIAEYIQARLENRYD
jgi:hypothetical protein